MDQDKELIKAAEDYAKGIVQDSIKDLEAQYGGEFTAGESCVPLVAKYFQAGAEWQKKHSTMDIIQQMLDYDVAIELIGTLKADAIRRCSNDSLTEEEKEKAAEEIRVYNADESVLNGYGTEDAKISVYDKVFRFYAPIAREL